MLGSTAIARASARLLTGAWRLAFARFGRWAEWRNRDWLDDAVPKLQTCQEALQRFGRKSDEDFTSLAQGLGHLNQRLAGLRNEAEQLDLILEDRDEDRALSSAHVLYKSSVDLVHASMGTAVSEQDQIKDIEDTLLHACRTRSKFKRNHLMLRILTMSVRMEVSRMTAGHRGVFLDVAAAIAEIGGKIAADTEAAFTRIEDGIAEARVERRHLKDLEQSLLGRAQSSIKRIEHELEALKSSLRPCVAQSHNVAELFSKVGPATLCTLASLQHQDIVRQQLEHVGAGFEDIRRHLCDDGSSGSPQARLERGYVHHAAGVQQAHLNAARAEIENAVSEVTSGLQALQAIGGQLAGQFTAMEAAGRAAFQDCQVAPMFREEIRQLGLIADMSESANGKISLLVERIAGVVSVFSKEISGHGLDVKIVSLNAQIAAAHLPSADALNKLAEETSSISAENERLTRDLIADLQTSLDALVVVKGDADEFLGIITREKGELERGVVVVCDKLARLGEHVQTRTAQARLEFEAAHRETGALLDGLAFPSLVASCFDPAERLCASLLAATERYASPDDLSAAASARLDSHRGRYTMHKETATHAAALSGVAAPAAAGDEIELFGVDEPLPPPSAPAGAGAHDQAPEPPAQPDRLAPAPAAPATPEFGDGIQLF